MRRLMLVCSVLVLAGPCAAGAQDRRGPPGGGRSFAARPGYANPSAVIAAEMAFAQDAQARGQWTAFAAAAANDAVMFTPRMVWAQQWLKGRANPPAAVRWQPYAVWSSCDGTLVVSHGVWRDGGSGKQAGWFTTLWRRQADGSYKWVLDHGDLSQPTPAEPDMIAAQVADCPPRARRAPGEGAPAKPAKPPKEIKIAKLPPLDPARRDGASADGSLRWEVVVAPNGGRTLTVRWTRDGVEAPLLVETVAAAAAAG